MSQAHIPQPDSGNAPGEQIQSTDSVPPLQSIEPLTPAAPEDISAVGEFNQLDPWFYNQFRRLTTIQWTTSDESGKLLWWIPITPLALDKNLAYVMRLYLAWLGSFVFNFKIAGTGFHAGLLSIVKTPPTIHPTKLRNPQDYTIMPWDAADPKMLEIGSFIGRDIRPIKYHYTEKQEGAPEDYWIGGYLALFVDMPLSTSSSGVPRINIAVWSKLAPDFRVSWMVPFNLQDVQTDTVAPNSIEYLTDFGNTYKNSVPMASNFEAANQLMFESSEIKVLNSSLTRCYSLNGEPMSSMYIKADGSAIPFPYAQQWYGWILLSIDATDRKKSTWYNHNFPMYQDPQPWNVVFSHLTGDQGQQGFHYSITKSTTVKDFRNRYDLELDRPLDDAIKPDEGRAWVITHFYDPIQAKWTDGKSYSSPVNGESFVLFKGQYVGMWSPQTYDLANLFSTGSLAKWFQPNQAALFQLYETDAQVPLGYVKLYYEGFMTTTGIKDRVEFLLGRLKFNFLNIVPRLSTIPDTPVMSSARLLVEDRHRRVAKASLKQLRSSASPEHSRLNRHGGSSSSSNGGRKYA